MKDQEARLVAALKTSRCHPGPTRAGVSGHSVLFYRAETQLVRSTVDYLADGLQAGQPIVVIATQAHRDAFITGLRDRGLDPEQLFSGRVAVWLDARETLAAFMEGTRPNATLFFDTVGAVFEKLLAQRAYLVIRGYGEMVDLLWKDGNAAGAIELERLWNELAKRYPHSLLCAYALESFLRDDDVQRFAEVCAQHSHALPMEDDSYAFGPSPTPDIQRVLMSPTSSSTSESFRPDDLRT